MISDVIPNSGSRSTTAPPGASQILKRVISLRFPEIANSNTFVIESWIDIVLVFSIFGTLFFSLLNRISLQFIQKSDIVSFSIQFWNILSHLWFFSSFFLKFSLIVSNFYSFFRYFVNSNCFVIRNSW